MTRGAGCLGEINPTTGLPTIPRTVKSTVRAFIPRRLCAVGIEDGQALMLIPDDAQVLSEPDEIIACLRRSRTPWTVATDAAGALHEWLARHGGDDYRARGVVHTERRYGPRGRPTRSMRRRAIFTDFRWEHGPRAMVLDPAAFCDLTISELLGSPPGEGQMRTLMRLCIWAEDVRRWCVQAGVNLRPGRGGIAAQFLTDLRWWPAWRRKVPRRLNDPARAQLPGNHYRMMSSRHYRSAIEMDQRSAHHQVARRVRFTSADTLHAYGATGDRATAVTRLWCAADDPRFSGIVSRPGLFWLRVTVSHRAVEHKIPLPQAIAEGVRTVAVWSPEVDEILSEPDIVVHGIVGAICSSESSRSLSVFAKFALAKIRAASPRQARWLKPLLLSVYGVLAQAPKRLSSWSISPTARSTPEEVVVGGRIMTVHLAESERAIEPRYANVIDRGIIEAETRAETIRVARAIQANAERDDRAEVVALYADSVLIGARPGARASDGEEHSEWARAASRVGLEAGRGEWRTSVRTDLRMLASNAYRSAEISKIPGRPREAQKMPICR